MDYNGYVLALSTMMGEQDPTNSDFQNILPSTIAYAEGRLYRDLDMLGTQFTDSSGTLVAGDRTFPVPSTTLVLEGVNVVNLTGDKRNQLVPVTREYLDFAWPTNAGQGIPQYFAMTATSGNLTVYLGPWPDQAYPVEMIGTQVQTPLSSSQTTTLLTTWLPETFLACSMIFASAYQKNFGAQSDNPQTSMSWEQQYQTLMKSAAVYEARKRFWSEGWSAKPPNPLVTRA